MKRRKKKTQPRRQNITAHRRAMANPALQRNVPRLHRDWPKLPSLPDHARQHLTNGGSAKKVLASRAVDRQRRRMVERLRWKRNRAGLVTNLRTL